MDSLTTSGSSSEGSFIGSLFESGWMTWVVIGTVLVALFMLPQVFRRRIGLGHFLGIMVFLGSALAIPYALQVTLKPTQTETLAAAAAEPVRVTSQALGPGEVMVSWETGSPVLGAVKYGASDSKLEMAAFELDPLDKKTDHEVVISNLQVGQTYYFEIISAGKPYRNSGKPYSFTVSQ